MEFEPSGFRSLKQGLTAQSAKGEGRRAKGKAVSAKRKGRSAKGAAYRLALAAYHLLQRHFCFRILFRLPSAEDYDKMQLLLADKLDPIPHVFTRWVGK